MRRLLSYLLIAAAFVFLAREILRNLDGLRDFEWHLRPWMLLLSLAALVAVLFLGVLYWGIVLRAFGVRVPLVALARTWFLANLSRYIPGVVWQFVSIAQLGAAAGMGAVLSITSLMVQMGFNLLAAGALGLLILPASALGEAYPLLAELRWLAPLALVAVHPIVIRTMVRWMARISRREAVDWEGTWVQGVALLLLAAVIWVVYGATFFLFLRAFVDLPVTVMPAVVAVHAVSFLVGYLAFFAPAGLGFKDAALTLLLAGMLPSSVAASLAVAARLWSIAGEVLPALVLLPGGVKRRERHRERGRAVSPELVADLEPWRQRPGFGSPHRPRLVQDGADRVRDRFRWGHGQCQRLVVDDLIGPALTQRRRAHAGGVFVGVELVGVAEEREQVVGEVVVNREVVGDGIVGETTGQQDRDRLEGGGGARRVVAVPGGRLGDSGDVREPVVVDRTVAVEQRRGGQLVEDDQDDRWCRRARTVGGRRSLRDSFRHPSGLDHVAIAEDEGTGDDGDHHDAGDDQWNPVAWLHLRVLPDADWCKCV